MIDSNKIQSIIDDYKKCFPEHWKDEKYKWQAVKHYQDIQKSNFNSFADRFLASTEKHFNLLSTGSYWQPRYMIGHFCNLCGDENVAAQFDMLYDESKDLKTRIQNFMDYFASEERIGKVSKNAGKTLKTNQDPRSISVYLATEYPDKYYFYMPSIYDKVKNIFNFHQPKGFSPIDKLLKYYEFCDEICKYIKQDSELVKMVSDSITEEEYNDKSLHILVQDILFFYMNYVKKKELLNKKIDLCWYVGAFISNENRTDEFIDDGIWINGYIDKYLDIVNSIKVGDRIAIKSAYTQKYNLPFNINGGTASVMEIKAVGTVTKNHKDGRTLDVEWIKLSPSKKWYFYTMRNIIWKVERTDDDSYNNALLDFTFEDRPQNYEDFLTHPFWADKYLIDCTPEEIEPEHERSTIIQYNKSDFLNDVYITSAEYDKLYNLLKHKKNIILQGAPGVGKTYSAKRLAYSIIGEKNESRICMVQFHQNYSYEDFIEGFRPLENGGFELRNGVFKDFCDKASRNKEKDFFFIIDEINRGNMSKIFGELLMLIEADKRGSEHFLNLVYSGKPFSVPENLHIIGMMNTADRSLAMIDYALRRRFSFYTMQPAFENADKNGFSDYTGKIDCKLYHTVISRIKELNAAIRKDNTLGKGFEIGHSYFAPEDISVINDEWVRNVVEYEIIPLIEEYWFDNDKKLDEWTKALYQAIGEEYDG